MYEINIRKTSIFFICFSIFITNELLAQEVGEVVADHYRCETYNHIVIPTRSGGMHLLKFTVGIAILMKDIS